MINIEGFNHLLGMTTSELEQFVESLGQPRFRGRQIASWMYKRNAASIDEMTDLPAALRAALPDNAVFYRSRAARAGRSRDGTEKVLLELEDSQCIEAVLLPYEDRVSTCVSTQVGCAAGCVFCATGLSGFARNLTAGEIVDEVLTLQRDSVRRITHVVYMGMGEPLLNYDNVLKSIRVLNEEVGIAMRHITISTVGITPRIEKLASENLQLTLAVSLHAPNDEIRRKIIPMASHYPLKELMRACRSYAHATRRRITFEYMMIRGVNDAPELARQLATLLSGILCNVNLIPYNAVENLNLNRPSNSQINAFRSALEEAGIAVTQRVEKGHTVSAACGQLRRKEVDV
jgi:23S rRNA (adenine2503-C2)-methyltransferase